jgi:hypothetical protein
MVVVSLGLMMMMMMMRTVHAETTTTMTTSVIANTSPSHLVTCPSSPIIFCLELIGYSDMESDDICVCDVESGHAGAFECSRPGGGDEDDDSFQVWCRGKVIGTSEFEIEEQGYIDAEKELDRDDSVMNAIESERQSSSSSSTVGLPSKSGSSDTRNIGLKNTIFGAALLMIGLAAMASVYQRQAHQILHRRRSCYNTSSTIEEEEEESPQSSPRSITTNPTIRNDNDLDTGRTNETTTTTTKTTTTAKSEVELALFEFV